MDASRPKTPLENLSPNIPSRLSPKKSKSVDKPLPIVPISPCAAVTGQTNVLHFTPGEISNTQDSTGLAVDLSVPASKRKLASRKRVCLPPPDQYGQTTNRLNYLTRAEVSARLVKWQLAGYSTSGFDQVEGERDWNLLDVQGQSRPSHPDLEGDDRHSLTWGFKVQIPNPTMWDEYVRQFQEDKLRVLGVSSSEDQLLPVWSSDSSHALSHDSSQVSTTIKSQASRPTVHSSGHDQSNTNQMTSNIPHLLPAKTANSDFGSATKPPVFGHSSFPWNTAPTDSSAPFPFSPNLNLAANTEYLNTNTPGSALQYLARFPTGVRTDRRMVSSPSYAPGVFGALQSFDSPRRLSLHQMYPASISQLPTSRAPMNFDDYSTRKPEQQGLRLEKHTSRGNVLQEPLAKRMLPEQSLVHEQMNDFDLPKSSTFTTDWAKSSASSSKTKLNIHAPVFNFNVPGVSAGTILPSSTHIDSKRSLVTSGQHLERSYSSNGLSSKLNAAAPEFQFEPKPASTEHHLSLRNSAEEPEGNARAVAEPASILSSQNQFPSKMNANAPDFKFEPRNFNVSSAALLPQQAGQRDSKLRASLQSKQSQSRASSVDSMLSRLNASAPIFSPLYSHRSPNDRIFSFGAAPIASSSSNANATKSLPPVFSFSTDMSTKSINFNPDAPSFQPSNLSASLAIMAPSINSQGGVDVPYSSQIFGAIEVQPKARTSSRESKAVPILPPKMPETSDYEDESGRIAQSEDRQKRIRRESGYEKRASALPETARIATNAPLPLTDRKETSTISAAGALATIDDPHVNQTIALDPIPATATSATPPGEAPVALFQSQGSFPQDDNLTVFKPLDEKGRAVPPLGISSAEHSAISDIASNAKALSPEEVMDIFRESRTEKDEVTSVQSVIRGNSTTSTISEPTRSCEKQDYLVKNMAEHAVDMVYARGQAEQPLRAEPPDFEPIRGSESEGLASHGSIIVASGDPRSSHCHPTKPLLMQDLFSKSSADSVNYESSAFIPYDSESVVDAHVSEDKNTRLIQAIVLRLKPLETSMVSIQESLESLARRPTSSGISMPRRMRSTANFVVEQSDADDEDDIVNDESPSNQTQLKSPLNDRNFCLKRNETSNTILLNKNNTSIANDTAMTQLLSAVSGLQSSIKERDMLLSSEHFAEAVDVEVKKQLLANTELLAREAKQVATKEGQAEMLELKTLLGAATNRSEDELKARRATEDALADTQRLLRQALQETAQHRKLAELADAKVEEITAERDDYLRRTAMLTGSQDHLELANEKLITKVQTMEASLATIKLAHEKLKEDNGLSLSMADNYRTRLDHIQATNTKMSAESDQLRASLQQVQEKLKTSDTQTTIEETAWRSKQAELKNRLDQLISRMEVEEQIREDFELELKRRGIHEQEITKLTEQNKQLANKIDTSESLLLKLRTEHQETQMARAALNSELAAMKELHKSELRNVELQMDNKAALASSRLSALSAEHHEVIQNKLQHIDELSSTNKRMKATHQTEIEGLVSSKATLSIQHQEQLKSLESASTALKMDFNHELSVEKAASHEMKKSYDRQICELEASIELLRAEHRQEIEDINRVNKSAQASHHLAFTEALKVHTTNFQLASDNHRQEVQHQHRLSMEQIQCLKEQRKIEAERVSVQEQRYQASLSSLESQISQLEEQLELARATPSSLRKLSDGKLASHEGAQPPIPIFGGLPEKISPQALRESIIVLQEQLQAREARIEDIEAELDDVDRDAPSKLASVEGEIAWLRELLGLRLDDLNEIIRLASHPACDRVAVQDAAIRLRTNLQMQQQLGERRVKKPGQHQALTQITSLAASPKALPTIAAAAWDHWKRGRTSVRQAASPNPDVISKEAQLQLHISEQTPDILKAPQSLNKIYDTATAASLPVTPKAKHQRRVRRTRNESSRPQSISLEDGEDPLAMLEATGALTTAIFQDSNYDMDAQETTLEDSPHKLIDDEEGQRADRGLDSLDQPFGPSIAIYTNDPLS